MNQRTAQLGVALAALAVAASGCAWNRNDQLAPQQPMMIHSASGQPTSTQPAGQPAATRPISSTSYSPTQPSGATAPQAGNSDVPVVRGQSGGNPWNNYGAPSNQPPSAPYVAPVAPTQPTYTQPAPYSQPAPGYAPTGSYVGPPPAPSGYAPTGSAPSGTAAPYYGPTAPLPAPAGYAPAPYGAPGTPTLGPNGEYFNPNPDRYADIIATVMEHPTGRFMIGAGINSSSGVNGQIVIEEQNFDITRWPTSFEELASGNAWRGGGQGLRIEAMPGTEVQRYQVRFTEPYLFNSRVSMSVAGFYFDRGYFDYVENRVGGSLQFGYRLTPDLTAAAKLRLEEVEISNPRVVGVQELDEVVGNNTVLGGEVSLTHDTRDVPFAPTMGHYFEINAEYVTGSFNFPRGEIDYRKYFLLSERADGSGRHTLGYSFKAGFSGSDTPIFERFYAGGYSTLRGFEFRGASPVDNTVIVGGDFRFLGSVEYMFPISADDMIRGVAFLDYGTVEENITIKGENFRVSPGLGLRIFVPALGPAPIALDFAVPVHHAPTDDRELFSFFFGVSR